MDIIKTLAKELSIRPGQAEAAVKLIDEGNTIPFIARYRKEATGSLNDEVLRQLDQRLRYLRNLEERKEQVLASIEEQGKLTEELRAQIQGAATLVAVEDLYLPYRPKRRTRATAAGSGDWSRWRRFCGPRRRSGPWRKRRRPLWIRSGRCRTRRRPWPAPAIFWRSGLRTRRNTGPRFGPTRCGTASFSRRPRIRTPPRSTTPTTGTRSRCPSWRATGFWP